MIESAATSEVVLEDRVGRKAAERLLVPWWSRRGGGSLAAWPAGRRARTTARLELVRLPVALGAATTRAANLRCYVVERVLGHGWAVALPSSAVQTEAAAVATIDAGAPLPAFLELDACASRLEALAMRGALLLGRGRPSALTALGPARAASYPFWLSYRRDRRGRLRFDALDAVTGSRPGNPLRAAIAAALVDADAGKA